MHIVLKNMFNFETEKQNLPSILQRLMGQFWSGQKRGYYKKILIKEPFAANLQNKIDGYLNSALVKVGSRCCLFVNK